MVRAREAAEADADLVELRLDMMERPDAAAALSGRRRKAVVTCRPVRVDECDREDAKGAKRTRRRNNAGQ